jgi:predicted ribosomally synthesized peptide with SipW-like signal peptide
MKKILGLVLAALVVMAMAGGATWAAFSDTETSSSNTFTAGTLNLKLTDGNETDQNGVTGSFSGSDLVPGDSVGPSTITLKNTGSVTANHVDIQFVVAVTDNATYDAADLGANVADMSASMTVSALSYGGTNLLTQTTPGTFDNTYIQAADAAGNNDDAITLNELDDVIIQSLTAPAASNGTKDFAITISLASGLGNGIQGDQVDVTVTFGLFQDEADHLS